VRRQLIMGRKSVNASDAAAIGPYSHAIESGDLVFLSGQTPIDSPTGRIVEGDFSDQTQQCFKNLFKVLEAAGLTSDHVEKVNVFLTDMNNFSAMNDVYSRQFTSPYPARTTIGVAALPMGALIEIEMIARR
jgi:2-iminobutanoate/2-iminopropanoate deaminase